MTHPVMTLDDLRDLDEDAGEARETGETRGVDMPSTRAARSEPRIAAPVRAARPAAAPDANPDPDDAAADTEAETFAPPGHCRIAMHFVL